MTNTLHPETPAASGGPRVYLAVDNCFASKRWTSPAEWMELAKDVGLSCVEASADNECDPLYTTPEYMADWKREIAAQSRRTGVRVSTLYSGHGSYATLGLAHTDPRIRRHMLDRWLKPMWRNARDLGAGLGFYCHAFADSVLQDPSAYRDALTELCRSLAELAAESRDPAGGELSVEQMYSPHQVPWTVDGAEELLRNVYAESSSPLYLTVDTGHAGGQRRFLRPSRAEIQSAIEAGRRGHRAGAFWLGPRAAYLRFEEACAEATSSVADQVDRTEAEMDRCPYLFGTEADGDPYIWLERLGAYSPIVHLQQTDGKSSAHLPFTRENNERGIITGPRVLRSLATSFARSASDAMPPPASDLYLTIEMFAGTTDIPSDIIYRLRESVRYWRRYVPEDGLSLSELVSRL